MLETRRRPAAGLIAAALLVGLAGAAPAVAAPPSPGGEVRRMPAARAAVDKAPKGKEALSLVVGLKPGVAKQAPAERLDDNTDVKVIDTEPLAGLDAVTVDVPAADQAEAVAALRSDPSVEYVEVDGKAHAFDVTPNDEFFAAQWGLHKTRVPAAWDTTTGSSAVTVAVVDTGVTAVPEIAGRVLPGRDFANNDDDATDDGVDEDGTVFGHGTAVATQIAGQGNNAAGIAGVCWNCQILPVKVLDRLGSGDISHVAEGIKYAADRGAQIINLSLGFQLDLQVVREAVAYAVARGALVVASAGNYNTTVPVYPAAIPSVVAVAASDQSDQRDSVRSESSYGPWVDVAAPGCNISQGRDGNYWNWCGTSSAAPVISGVAALALAARPGVTAGKLRAVITNGAVPVPGGWVANGRVAADVAVRNIGDDVPPTSTAVAPAQGARVRGIITSTIYGVADAFSGVHRAELWVNGKYHGSDVAYPYSLKVNTTGRNGVQSLQWRLVDRAGNVSSFNRSVIADHAGPTVKITSGPKNKAKVKGTVTVKASATDPSGVHRVEVVVNGKVVGKDLTSPYSFKIKVSKYGKKLTVKVRAYDRLGNVRYVATRTWRR